MGVISSLFATVKTFCYLIWNQRTIHVKNFESWHVQSWKKDLLQPASLPMTANSTRKRCFWQLLQYSVASCYWADTVKIVQYTKMATMHVEESRAARFGPTNYRPSFQSTRFQIE